MELQQFLEENFDLKFLKWTEIILQEDKAVKLDSMYILVRDQNYCDLIFVDGKGKKRKIENVSKDALKVDFPLLDLSNLTPGLILDWKTKLGGLDGAAATIQVGDVYTVENEEEARIMNVGDETNAVFDFYIPKGNPGQPGADGNDGSNGLNGTNVLQGNTVPNNTLGSNGDSYINVSTADIYSKSSGLWNLTGNIKGKQGDSGTDGTNAQSFNFKGNVVNYAALPSSGNVINDGYYNESDSLIYIYNGASFPDSGKGIAIGNVPSSVRTWSAEDVGLVSGSERLRNNSLYIVKTGQVSTSLAPELDDTVWQLVSINWDSLYKDRLNPTLEVGGLALINGGLSASTQRGRTVSFLSIQNAIQLELIGDMLIQAIFYYTDANVFVSRQDIAAKTFTPTIPPTATKFKLAFHHVVNTQTVTQAELNALILNCYSSLSTSVKDVIATSKSSAKLNSDYSLVDVNIGFGAIKELGRINLVNGADQSSTTGIRTKLFPIKAGEFLITQLAGYKVSRVVNYKDGAYVSNNLTITNGSFLIPNDNTVNQIRLVFDKLPDGSATITAQEVIDFTFSVSAVGGNKLDYIYEEAKKTKPLPTKAYFANQQTAILNTIDTDINFDLSTRKLIISGGSLIDSGNVTVGRISLPISTVGTDMPSSITAAVVLYNNNNNSIVIQNQTAAPLDNHYILFTYRYTGSFESFYVTGIDNYSVNGLPRKKKDTRVNNRFSVDNFGVPYWSAPVQEALDPSGLNSNVLYELYNTVAEQFPTNVTKTLIGLTESPTPYEVIRYDISFNKRVAANQRRRKPRIFVCGGIHGGEKIGVYSTYLFFKFLLENPNNDEILTMLKTNYDWTFIPLVNPYALNVGEVGGNESVRWNHNGVDINRNFDFRWAEYADGGVGSQSYKGTAPFSEKESQYVRDTFNSIKADTVLYIDCHNFGSTGLADPRLVWFASSFNSVQNTVFSLCDRFDYQLKKRYDYLPKNQLIAYSDIDGASPMSQAWIANQQVLAVTLETDQSDIFNPVDPSNYNSNVVTRTIEVYTNTFYSLGKHAVDFVNNAVNN